MMADNEILNYESNSYSKLKNLKFAINQSAIVTTTDAKGTIIDVNDRFCEISKYSKEELLGQNHRILKSGYHPHEFFLNLWKTISSGKVWVGQIRNRAKNGSYYWVHTTIIPFLDEKGKVYQYLSIRFDITPLKELEISLEKKIVEVEKKNNELQIANKELELFSYVSSHHFQEPLRKIQVFSDYLIKEEKRLSDTGKDYFHRMQKAAKRMQKLFEDLLAYSRIKRAEGKFESLDLNIIFDEVRKDYTEVIKEKHVTIVVKELCVAKIIPFQFRQLIHHLFSNALKFTNSQNLPCIVIESEILKGNKLNNEKLLPKMDYCHLIFTDNGIGFDPQYKDRVFELFQRLHSIEDYEGSGVGLAICKKIVECHNGVITATGNLNNGARFDIYIPAE